MKYGTVKYLEQTKEINNLWYSLPLTTVSVAVGVTQVAFTDYSEQGSKFVVVNGIILSSGIELGAANLVTFTDNFGNVLFVMDASRDANGYIEIDRIIESPELRITATFQTPPVTDYFFTVEHQYLRNVDKGIKF